MALPPTQAMAVGVLRPGCGRPACRTLGPGMKGFRDWNATPDLGPTARYVCNASAPYSPSAHRPDSQQISPLVIKENAPPDHLDT